uniref:Uncharacterized protein n=1 Tax=Romanomermis culicivorax TaxID=13658 RepID=A0A915HFP4_ROMCU
MYKPKPIVHFHNLYTAKLDVSVEESFINQAHDRHTESHHISLVTILINAASGYPNDRDQLGDLEQIDVIKTTLFQRFP